MHRPTDVNNRDAKTDVPGFYKSLDTNAVINKDNESLLAYKKRKKLNKKTNSLDEDVKILKKDMEDIKALLLKLVEK